MTRFTKRNSARKNGDRKSLTHRHLSVESLESRELLAVDMTALDVSSNDRLIDMGLLEGDAAEMVHIINPQFKDGTSGESRGDQPGRQAAGAERVNRSDNWFSKLSPVVRSSIEHARDLRAFSDTELRAAPSWAVVTGNPEACNELLDAINPNSVHDHTDLFRDRLNVSVWEVQLANPGDYRQLVELARQDGGRSGTPDTAPVIVDVFPLFTVQDAPTGTLDPATVNDPGFANQWYLDATANNTQWGIDAEGAWATATGEDVTIAIVDTRQDVLHLDLAGSYNAAISFDSGNIDWNNDGIPGDNNPNVTMVGNNPNWPNILDTDANFDGILETDRFQFQSHGTAVAGIALGDDEGTGIVGVAPDANYAAFNFLEPTQGTNAPFLAQSIPNTFSAANIAPIDVFNNSWGSPDTRLLRYRNALDLQAMENAATSGIFVKSAGNNRDVNNNVNPVFNGWDRTNYDAAHMRQTIMVAAAQQDGGVEFYSNPGSNNLISAPVNQTAGANSLTSDVTDDFFGQRGYAVGTTTDFNGTSAAAPMVSGTVALMLETNPGLDGRNVQHILIDTAQKNGLIDLNNDGIFDGGDGNSDGVIDTINLRNTFLGTVDTTGNGIPDTIFDTDRNGAADPYHTGWFQNGAGNWVSDNFGFGMLDTNSAVQSASTWVSVGPELHVNSPSKTPFFGAIPEGNLAGLNSLNSIDSYFSESHLQVEWVEITVEATVPDQSNLMLALQSPSGTQSVLMAPGGLSADNLGNAQTDIDTFTFSTNQFWDESANGVWTLQALDTVVGDGLVGTIDNWQIDIYGTCCDASPLKVISVDNSLTSVGNLAKMALAAGGLESDMYEMNQVNQVGESLSMGVFSNGIASGLPMDEGLLFTSGRLKDAVGPNDRDDTGGGNNPSDWNNPGHKLLDNLTGQKTFDASGLEIYFTPTEDVEISFDHLFGSEEFDEYVGSVFNDGAGIFLGVTKGPDSHYTDGAILPINLAQTFNGEDLTVNELASQKNNGSVSGKYYNPNPICGDMNWEYDGTSLLSHTNNVKLNAGWNYYIGIMVADAFDGIYDSAFAIGLDGSSADANDIFTKHRRPLLPISKYAQMDTNLKLDGAKDSPVDFKQTPWTDLRLPTGVPNSHPTAIDMAWRDMELPQNRTRNLLLSSDRDNSNLLGNRTRRLQASDARNVRANEMDDILSEGRNRLLHNTSIPDAQADALASALGRDRESSYPALLDFLLGDDKWLNV